MIIRPETPEDASAIRAVTIAAFDGHPHSDQTEHLIVERLRQADALIVSLVAVIDGAVVGHVAFSPVTMGNGVESWFGLGPLSVLPVHQGTGIGTQLVRTGLEHLQGRGAAGCVVVGDPLYYSRFGFRSREALEIRDIPLEYFTVRLLRGPPASGMVTYHSAFYGGAA